MFRAVPPAAHNCTFSFRSCQSTNLVVTKVKKNQTRFVLRFVIKLNFFSADFWKTLKISNFFNFFLMGPELLHADRRTDMAKLKVVPRNFANGLENWWMFCSRDCTVYLLTVRRTGTDHTDTQVWANIMICRSVDITVKSVFMSSPSWGPWPHFKNWLVAQLTEGPGGRIGAMGPGQGRGRADGPGRGGQGSGLGEGCSEPHREHRELPLGGQISECCIGK